VLNAPSLTSIPHSFLSLFSFTKKQDTTIKCQNSYVKPIDKLFLPLAKRKTKQKLEFVSSKDTVTGGGTEDKGAVQDRLKTRKKDFKLFLLNYQTKYHQISLMMKREIRGNAEKKEVEW
jgi:hypothetical protein